ncbi:UDP-N-acetylmuramoyl-tripeptide--D-alanyl-D-alanine ligase [Patescibacteria group bacterium]
MKTLLRKIVLKKLEILARIKLRRMNAKVIGVTGSVGKTTCKDAIYDVLSKKYRVLKNKKSFNSEFGLPLTILHQDSGFGSAKEWMGILWRGFVRTFFVEDKYDYLILEMGVDKPGDMDFLVGLAKPNIAIITAIKPVHLDDAQFKNVEEIFKEKSKICNDAEVCLVNHDDQYISKLQKENVHTYGSKNHVDYRVKNFEQTEEGIEFDVENNGNSYQFYAPLYGQYWTASLMPAIVLGFTEGVGINDIIDAIENYKLPPGRLSLIEGQKESLILDSTYNAAPEGVKESLKVLDFFGKNRNKRRVCVLGNMNELGEFSKELHEEVGAEIPQNCDLLLTVGEDVRYAASSANKHGMDSSKIKSFPSAKEAAKYYKEIMNFGDIVLVKGSQNKVRLEIFVKALMKHPDKAKELLVRQGEKWQNIAP